MIKKEGQNTMECKNARIYIQDYLDGELNADEKLALKLHLSDCKNCQKQYKEAEEVEAMVKYNMQASNNFPKRSEQDIQALTDKIMQGIPMNETRKSKKRFVKWIYKYPAITAAAVFVLVMLTSLAASYGQQSNITISASQDDLSLVKISGNTVTVPEGTHLTGDLLIENGIIEIKGAVDGNVTVIDGQLVMASTGYIAGQSKTIDQALDWLWYKISSSVTSLVPEWNTSTVVSLL